MNWLKTSVPLDYPSAAISLIRFYGNSEAPADQQQRYVYARVAAGYWESIKSAAPRDGFDATALQAHQMVMMGVAGKLEYCLATLKMVAFEQAGLLKLR